VPPNFILILDTLVSYTFKQDLGDWEKKMLPSMMQDTGNLQVEIGVDSDEN
jgi:hypothetical protein